MPTWFAVVASALLMAVALPFAELGICAASILISLLWVWWLVTRPPRALPLRSNAVSASTHSVVADRGGVAKMGEEPSAAQRADTGASRAHLERATSSVAPRRPEFPTPAQLPTDAIAASSRTNSQLPTPARFERNRGVAGHLYVARNDQHCDNLFKLGQTANSVADRLLRLNQEHSSGAHVGEFRSVYSVQVTDALGDEERLFQLLSAYRVHAGTEFFMVPMAYLIAVMAALSAESSGATNDAFATLPPPPAAPRELRAMTRDGMSAPIPSRPAAGGFVVVLRNKWHKPNLFRIASTERELIDYLDGENATQRRHTSQIGFYDVVEAFAAERPRAVCASTLREARAHRVGRSAFVVMPLVALLDVIKREIENAEPSIDIVASASHRDPQLPRRLHPEWNPIRRQPALGQPPTSPAKIEPVQPALAPRQRPGPGETWRTNTCPYPRCFASVRAAGPVGQVGKLRCSTCRRVFEFAVTESSTLEVWHD